MHHVIYANNLSCFLVLMNNCVVVSQENGVVKAFLKAPRVRLFLEAVIDHELSCHSLMSRLVFLMASLSKLYPQEDFLPLLVKFFDRLLLYLQAASPQLAYSLIDLSSLFHLAHYFLSTVDFDLYVVSTNFSSSRCH